MVDWPAPSWRASSGTRDLPLVPARGAGARAARRGPAGRRPGGTNDGVQTDELHTVRERTRLVAAFDATLTRSARRRSTRGPGAGRCGPRPPRHRRQRPLFGRTRGAPCRGVEPRPLYRPTRRRGRLVEAVGGRPRQDRSRTRRAAHPVDHARRQSELMVALPDGELEDTGTTFTVSARRPHDARRGRRGKRLAADPRQAARGDRSGGELGSRATGTGYPPRAGRKRRARRIEDERPRGRRPARRASTASPVALRTRRIPRSTFEPPSPCSTAVPTARRPRRSRVSSRSTRAMQGRRTPPTSGSSRFSAAVPTTR